MKQHIVVLLFVFIGCFSFAQDDEVKEMAKALNASTNITWDANKALSEDKFVEAEVDYRKAISKSDENVAAPFNLGNAYYNKETYSEAFGRFKEAGEIATDKKSKHKAFHNMGNVFMKRKEYEKAVEGYKQALRNDPTDEETRYNLALAKELLKKEQDDKKDDKNDEDKDEDKDDKKDKEDENKDKKEGDDGDKEDNKDEDNKEDGDKGDEEKEDNKEGEGDEKKEQDKKPEEGDQKEQPKQPRPNQLSKQQVQNLLEAMQNEEKKVQEKIDAQKVKGVKVKNEKDW